LTVYGESCLLSSGKFQFVKSVFDIFRLIQENYIVRFYRLFVDQFVDFWVLNFNHRNTEQFLRVVCTKVTGFSRLAVCEENQFKLRDTEVTLSDWVLSSWFCVCNLQDQQCFRVPFVYLDSHSISHITSYMVLVSVNNNSYCSLFCFIVFHYRNFTFGTPYKIC